MAIHVSDERLFTIVLYSAFVNNNFLSSFRDVWEASWLTGVAAASAIGLAYIAPMILMAIIYALGFTAEGIAAGSFGAWFMSLYGGMVARGSLISILQSIGATGELGALGASIVSGFGAAIGILIVAVGGGSKLEAHFGELNEHEKHTLENFVQIEENNNLYNMTIFTLMPALLYNDTMLKCFVEIFKTCSLFANYKLFKFYFKENDSLKLKSEEEKVNNTVYNLLTNDYEKSRLNYIFHDNHLIGYNLDLNGYKSSDGMMNLLVEIWMYVNGIFSTEFDIDKIGREFAKLGVNISHEFSKLGDKISHEFGKIGDKVGHDVGKLGDKIGHEFVKIGDKVGHDVGKIGDKVGHDVGKLGDEIGHEVGKIGHEIDKVGHEVADKIGHEVDDKFQNILRIFHLR